MQTETDHYADRYWNEVPGVLAYLCLRATGDQNLWWMDDFKARYATPPRKRGLVIGCGNGWAERDLIDRGVADRFDAFDVSTHYLAQAESLREDRPIRYFQSDFRTFSPAATYDLIVNVAALHHAQYLFGLTYSLWRALEPHGIFVNWDYVGPSRNQYSRPHVAAMERANRALPERFRTPHPIRPPLHTILRGDPTEAVHAPEIFRVVEQYFDILERHDLGGGIAYQILWNNVEEFLRDDPEAQNALDYLLQMDEQCTGTEGVPTLFSFFICRKRRHRPPLRALYDRAVREPLREAFSRTTQGLYPKEVLRLFVGSGRH